MYPPTMTYTPVMTAITMKNQKKEAIIRVVTNPPFRMRKREMMIYTIPMAPPTMVVREITAPMTRMTA